MNFRLIDQVLYILNGFISISSSSETSYCEEMSALSEKMSSFHTGYVTGQSNSPRGCPTIYIDRGIYGRRLAQQSIYQM